MMTDDLLQQALKLPAEKKEELLLALLNDLSTDEEFEVSKEWMDEIRRRAREADENPESLIPWETVKLKIQAMLDQK